VDDDLGVIGCYLTISSIDFLFVNWKRGKIYQCKFDEQNKMYTN